MAVKFIPRDRFSEVIAGITKGRQLFGHQLEAEPSGQAGRPHMVLTSADDLVLGTARAVEPVKALLFPPRDDLGGYFADKAEPNAPPVALVGATACDLRALKVLDQVFLGGEFKDPYYEKKRKNLLVVSMDCTLPFDVCFCMFFGDAPHPSEGYDLNLSPLAGGKDGYLVEPGSEQGEKLLAEAQLIDASDALIERRAAQRKEAVEQVFGVKVNAVNTLRQQGKIKRFRGVVGKRPDYKKAIGQPEGLAELAVFYCERAVGFSNDVGLQDEGYFDALVRMFGQALKTIDALPEDCKPPLMARLDSVRHICHNFGYGVGDDMDDLLAEYGFDGR